MPSVPGFVHAPGHHCGSTALRNLLGFHGVEISEEVAFGLGAGAGFYYLAMEDSSPSRWFNGRTARLEETFRELTGAALELRTFAAGTDGEAWDADDEAWRAARSQIDAGRPALLLTDIYYLDHYGNSAHFPGHAVVLAGYDQVIERRGTGGGCFRLMYARFLAEAGWDEAPLAAAAGARWTELAAAFKAASEEESPSPELWRQVSGTAGRVLEAERRLWTALGEHPA